MCVEELKGNTMMYVSLTHAEKTKMEDKAKSTIIMCLKDKLLMEVERENIMIEMWVKLE